MSTDVSKRAAPDDFTPADYAFLTDLLHRESGPALGGDKSYLLRDVILPAAARRRWTSGVGTARSIRVWCAASSTGQEPYSVAMCAALAAPRRGAPRRGRQAVTAVIAR